MHVKKGDMVKIITGKDKGKSGKVVHAFPKENAVIVDGAGIYKRHQKGRAGQAGQIIERARPINASNVVRVEK